MKRILIAQPSSGRVEPEASRALTMATKNGLDGQIEVAVSRPRSSLLSHAFNLSVAHALNDKYDYWCLLHEDIWPDDYWLDLLLQQMHTHDLDAIHAVSPIKDTRGVTSTAVAYSGDRYAPVRRITTTELQNLPVTFGIDELRQSLDPDADRLLPNTGCLLLCADTWLKDFPGFTIHDRVIRAGDEWGVDVCSEDWNFGHWCAENSVAVGGTRAVKIYHLGRHGYTSACGWGTWKTDQHYFDAIENLKGLEHAV